MQISRNTRLVPEQLLRKLLQAFENGTELSPGGLSYQRLDFQELYEILPDAFVVTPAISRSEAIGLFGRALRQCRHAGPLTGDAILSVATALHHTALAVPPSRFTMWTKFRAQGMDHASSLRLAWRGVRVRTAAQLPAWLSLDEYFLIGVGRIFPREPHGYGHIILTCDDRDEDRAVDRMMNSLQLILGLTNLYETWGRHSHWGGRNWTEGGLWLGPNQFVFKGKAFRGEERIWYNPAYDKDAWTRHPPKMQRILQIMRPVRRALTALEQHPLRDNLVRTTMLLQDGFATRDSSHRLLSYWSALEQLYVEAEAKGRSNEKVLERATFAETEPHLSRWKLDHIARLRNDYVHAGGSGDDFHDMCQFLRGLLARHLNHWIMRGQDLADHAALLAFVKLPPERAKLVRMRDTIDRRIAFIDSAPAPQSGEE